MALLPKRAAKLDITIEEGASLPINLTVKNKVDSSLVDLSGYAAKMQIRETKDSADPAILELTDGAGITLGGVNGTVAVNITATQSSTVHDALSPGKGVYDLELIPASGIENTWRFIEGEVIVDSEVTK